ncbi:MAG: hypothetical protein A3I09_02560 [Deltaproteobacteria bacterium RIFCSPLOWO2_02_FULL_47_10]|nr:MAG: hypothetical protein A3I09_02560 [Deltaproteobacteria bacterium RIFCSPLOWO2_02_FULL_47_10]
MGDGKTSGVSGGNAQTECRQRFFQEVSKKTGWDLTGYDFAPACKKPDGYPTVVLCSHTTVDDLSKKVLIRTARTFAPTPEQIKDAFRTPYCNPVHGREVVELVASHDNNHPPFNFVLYYLLRSEWYFCGDPATQMPGPHNVNSSNLIIDESAFNYLKSLYESCE